MNRENSIIISIISIFISIVAVTLVIASNGSNMGGYTAGHWDSADGYKVDGATVIDGDGNVDASITSDTGTFSSTLTVTGETSVSGFVQGGSSYSTSTGSALVLTAAQMCDNGYIKVTPSAAINVTTAATSTLIADCIPAIGDRASFYFENGATGAGTTTTMVAGSGIDLIEPSGGDVIIAGNEDAFIEMLNVDGSTVKIFITSLQVAD